MPMPYDPDAVLRIVLESDENKSPQPAFLYRHLSYRKWCQLEELQRRLAEMRAEDVLRKQMEFLEDGLAGWENITDPDTGQPLPFDKSRIADIVSMVEAQEILQKRLVAGIPGIDVKKKSSLPSVSDTGKSAEAAKGQ